MQDEILIKYLLGEAEVEEVTLVDMWLENSEQNQQYLLNLRTIWDQSKQLENDNHYNIEEQWQLLRSKIKATGAPSKQAFSSENQSGYISDKSKEGKNGKVLPIGSGRKIAASFWKWAAAVVLLAFGSWIIFSNIFTKQGLADDLVITATASPVTDTLSDGSIITLNHYSRLLAPLSFKGKNREVTLKQGEAFFQVVHLDKKPFLVHSGAVDLKVLGTSFNIKMEGGNTVIHVATGKVQIAYKGQHLILQANEQISISAGTTKLVSQKTESLLYNYYVTRQFIARNTRLEDLVKVLNDAYGAHIVFANNNLKELRLTTVFVQQPIDKILDIIAATFNIQLIHGKDSITLQ